MPVKPDPNRVADLFDAIVDLDESEAARVLDVECAGDLELRRAVEALARHDRKAAREFLAPRPELFGEAFAEQQAQLAKMSGDSRGDDGPYVGARIGRFVVVRKLGEGAMGMVYLAYDEVLDRRVALKLLRPHIDSAPFLLREGRALGRLAHPNVVAVHEAGEHEGRVYLAMEFVEGRTLRAFLDEKERSFREVLDMFLGVARGLAAVHDAGLVHRDFKPENVLVGRDDRPRVVDFGIATVAKSEPVAADENANVVGASRPSAGALEVSLLRSGIMVGTPAFMAPEQLRGERATLASDQWSFCVALYRAVYGVPPFPLDGHFITLSRRVIEDEPLPPPKDTHVPEWLGPMLLRGLAKDPAQRYASMHALIAAIEQRLPRDPELDGSVVRRDILRIRAAVFVATAMATMGFLKKIVREALDATALALLSVCIIGLASVVITIRWRRLAQNRYGRRAAALFIGGNVAMLVHRLLAMRLGSPLPEILVDDMVVTATFFGTVAVVVEKWIGLLAVISMLGAFLGAFLPEFAWAALMGSGLLNLAILTGNALRKH